MKENIENAEYIEEQDTNLRKIKIETYIASLCILCMFFTRYALIVAVILQIHTMIMLTQDSKSPTLFRRYVAAFVANLLYVLGLYLVSPSNNVALFYVGLGLVVISAPLLFKSAMSFIKEMIVLTKNRVFWAIIVFVVMEFYAGAMWIISTLWFWWGIDLRGFEDKAFIVLMVSAFIVTAIFAVLVFFTDDFPAKEKKNSGESNSQNYTNLANKANESSNESYESWGKI